LLKNKHSDNDEEGRDIWLQPLLDGASDNSVAEIMDSEDPLFILYTSVRQENRKEWFTPLVIWFIPLILLKNVFNYEENDIFWCTADIVGLQVILIFCMAPY
jgi:acetyl-CoA synthetase